MNKRIIITISIIIITILILTILLLLNNYINHPKIVIGIAKITGKEISDLNSKFEEFYGTNKSEDLKKLLQYCIKNYKENFLEYIKIPKIKYITESNEILLKFENENLSENEEETKYYLGINELIENISSDKLYKVDFKYMQETFDNVSLIEEIEITEL
ncbi:MAG: hypothetical protein J6A36_00390 [Clostridia bacterium]|nr:hypothetical protein [Clostridia bacterium]